MLLRTLEPEVMDTTEDAEEYDALDFSEPNGRFAERALALVAGVPFARVVDLGAGTGDIPVRMLARREDLRIVAVDLADAMLAVARGKAERAGVGARLEAVRADVKGTELPAGSFDMVMSNSTAHHIPEPVALFREIARLVRPGGAVLVRDLFRPESEEAALATVERVCAGVSPRQRRLFFDSLCAALTLDEVKAIASAAGLAGATIEIVSDRHWTVERAAGT